MGNGNWLVDFKRPKRQVRLILRVFGMTLRDLEELLYLVFFSYYYYYYYCFKEEEEEEEEEDKKAT
jgi:hypothetical protein